MKIDAVWLAGRPSLRDFLERLRETRQMPEQKDFAAWRRKLSELEEGARSGTYEENWQLPSGKIFRVTGRPHPQGALAFLFEDISTAIMLERRYRSELEISQATLDRVSEAVAVFDASGTLVFVNAAFESLWGLDPMARLDGPGVAEMTAFWEERCAPTPVWGRLAEFATAAEARTSWTETIETRSGRTLRMLVAPCPTPRRSSSSATPPPRRSPPPGAADGVIGEIALEQMRLPAEAALPRLLAAIPAAPDARGLPVARRRRAGPQGRPRALARADQPRPAPSCRGAAAAARRRARGARPRPRRARRGERLGRAAAPRRHRPRPRRRRCRGGGRRGHGGARPSPAAAASASAPARARSRGPTVSASPSPVGCSRPRAAASISARRRA